MTYVLSGRMEVGAVFLESNLAIYVKKLLKSSSPLSSILLLEITPKITVKNIEK